MNNSEKLILFHGNCPDGIMAAWAAWLVYGDSASYVPMMHHNATIPDCSGKDVFMLDYASPRAILLDAKSKSKSFLILDHHIGVEEELRDLDFAIFDMNRSGAGMAWDYFHPNTPRPAIIDLVEDRDIRKFYFCETDPILHLFDDAKFHQHFLGVSVFKRISAFVNMVEDDKKKNGGYDKSVLRMENISGLMIGGVERHRKFMALCENMSAQATPINIGGFSGLAVNCQVPFEDAIGTILAKRCNGVGVVYHHTPWNPRNVKISLRSSGDLDVKSIAKELGGNGHFHAAGCNIPFDMLYSMFSLYEPELHMAA